MIVIIVGVRLDKVVSVGNNFEFGRAGLKNTMKNCSPRIFIDKFLLEKSTYFVTILAPRPTN